MARSAAVSSSACTSSVMQISSASAIAWTREAMFTVWPK